LKFHKPLKSQFFLISNRDLVCYILNFCHFRSFRMSVYWSFKIFVIFKILTSIEMFCISTSFEFSDSLYYLHFEMCWKIQKLCTFKWIWKHIIFKVSYIFSIFMLVEIFYILLFFAISKFLGCVNFLNV